MQSHVICGSSLQTAVHWQTAGLLWPEPFRVVQSLGHNNVVVIDTLSPFSDQAFTSENLSQAHKFWNPGLTIVLLYTVRWTPTGPAVQIRGWLWTLVISCSKKKRSPCIFFQEHCACALSVQYLSTRTILFWSVLNVSYECVVLHRDMCQ